MGRARMFTNHLCVLALLTERSDVRVREIADAVGITERATHRIISELVADGYLTRRRTGARNQYEIHPAARVDGPLQCELTLGQLLLALNAEAASGVQGAVAEPVQPPRRLQTAQSPPITGP
jgi:predicted transcriptional regulator